MERLAKTLILIHTFKTTTINTYCRMNKRMKRPVAISEIGHFERFLSKSLIISAAAGHEGNHDHKQQSRLIFY